MLRGGKDEICWYSFEKNLYNKAKEERGMRKDR